MGRLTDRVPSGDPREAERHASREERSARVVLVVVGVSYLAVQLTLLPADRAPGWDESVYLSQVMPGAETVFFDAWRARGLPLLIAPFTWTGSTEAVRLALMTMSSLAMTASFWVWVPLIGLAAPVAAFAFSFSWLGLVNGSEVMPNLWAAILGLATVGFVGRSVEDGRVRHGVLAGLTVCVAALIRPTEATVVAGTIALYVLLFQRRSWRVLEPVGIGLVAGWLPWLIEMSVRFGGPVDALREAAMGHFGSAQTIENVIRHLSYTGGNLQGAEVPTGGALWWGILLAMGAVAFIGGVKGFHRTASLLASLGTLALGAEYLVFGSAAAPRFLLPAYAFGSLAAAIGAVSLIRRDVVSRVLGTSVLALAVPWAIWQGAVAEQIGMKKSILNEAYRVVGLELHELVRGRPCAFVSPRGYPEIQIASGCEGEDIVDPGGPSPSEFGRLLVKRPKLVYVVLPRKASPRSGLGSLSAAEIPTGKRTWFIYPISGLAP